MQTHVIYSVEEGSDSTIRRNTKEQSLTYDNSIKIDLQGIREEKVPDINKITDQKFLPNLNKHESKADRIMRVYRQRKREQSIDALKTEPPTVEQS